MIQVLMALGPHKWAITTTAAAAAASKKEVKKSRGDKPEGGWDKRKCEEEYNQKILWEILKEPVRWKTAKI